MSKKIISTTIAALAAMGADNCSIAVVRSAPQMVYSRVVQAQVGYFVTQQAMSVIDPQTHANCQRLASACGGKYIGTTYGSTYIRPAYSASSGQPTKPLCETLALNPLNFHLRHSTCSLASTKSALSACDKRIEHYIGSNRHSLASNKSYTPYLCRGSVSTCSSMSALTIIGDSSATGAVHSVDWWNEFSGLE